MTDDNKAISKVLIAVCLILAVAGSAAWPQDSTLVRVRGTIERVDGEILGVRSRDGSELTIHLAENAPILAVVKAAADEIRTGMFVGVTALPQPDGTWRAVEVHIFPDALRGTGEGDRPWDLHPQSTMTNATVANFVTKVEGRTLTLKYRDGEKIISVPQDAVIAAFVTGDRVELKPGAKIFIPAASRQPDGSLQAARLVVGRDGIAPPM